VDLEKILAMLKNINGKLSLIVDLYAQVRGEFELEPYLDDPEISTDIVYIWDELPYLDPRIILSLKKRLDAGSISEKDRPWVDAILFNHG
jgi:hypothetical protein